MGFFNARMMLELIKLIKVHQHLIEINFSMTDLIKDSAIDISIQAYDGELGGWSTIIGGPPGTFQSVGDNYQVRTYWPASGVKVALRILATMENGDSIPSATAFEYTPTLVLGSAQSIRENF